MKGNLSTHEMVLVGLCAALMGVFSQLAIPLPFTTVPLTLQAFGVVIIAIILEAKLATFALLVYTLVGAIGLPVFANFGRGLGVVVGPTGGYIIGFIAMAFIIGFVARQKNKILLALGVYIGLAVEFVFGVMQLKWVLGLSMEDALISGLYPFLLKDIIMAGLGTIVALQIKRRVGGILRSHVKA